MILVGSLSLLFIALGAISIGLLFRAVERQFIAGAEWLAHEIADEVALYLSPEQRLGPPVEELNALAKEKVAEYLLYAQVVQDGKVLAEDRSPAATHLELRVGEFSEVGREFVRAKRRLPHGGAYLDLMKRLPEGAGSPGYVRLGISLASPEATGREGALIIALASLGGLVANTLLILWLSGRIFAPVPVGEGPKIPAGQVSPLEGAPANLIQVGNLCIDDSGKEVRRGDQVLQLSPKEYELLKLLALEPGRVFSNEEILGEIWQGGSLASADDVRKYIRFLRQKLEEDPQNPKLIMTIAGFGYKLQP